MVWIVLGGLGIVAVFTLTAVLRSALRLALSPSNTLERWRIMGMWDDGDQFLVVMGNSKQDCLDKLPDALIEMSDDDFDELDSLWCEYWGRATPWEPTVWIPTEFVTLIGLRVKLHHHQQRQRQRQRLLESQSLLLVEPEMAATSNLVANTSSCSASRAVTQSCS